MTCRARRESFFWLPIRQFFLFSLFSFFSFFFFFSSSFLQPSRRPCLGSSRLSRAVSCVSLSPIVNLAHRQSRLPRLFFFSSNLFAKQQEQKKRSERQFNSPPKKPSFPAPPPGHFLPSPFASPRIFFLSLNCQRVVRDVPPPTFPLPSSRALKQNLSAVHLRDLFFFFQTLSAFILCTSHVSPNRYRQPAPNWFIFSVHVELQYTAYAVEASAANALDVGSFPVSLDPGLGRNLSHRCSRCQTLLYFAKYFAKGCHVGWGLCGGKAMV